MLCGLQVDKKNNSFSGHDGRTFFCYLWPMANNLTVKCYTGIKIT